ncbi:hypothetical protein [Clostridium paraputrificum]|uniref:hypothetical protein n=1 Tax=Clostridium paraputrificum TaxID=29363 RepID=UPI001A9C188B|nr:hypothetical protein [Clostridium paraputrificum]MDB2118633.1 hypothetical protein [Clostridium paraputrificum]
MLKAKLFYEERIKITEVRRYKVQGKKVKRENNDNKDRDELCLWQSSFFCWN